MSTAASPALIAYATHYEIGWVAWGIGALVGFAVAQSAREPSASLGATAAVIAVAALIVAKVLILEFALPSIMRGEVLKDRGATAAMFLLDMGINRSFSPELQRQIAQTPDNAPLERQEELQQRMISEVRARAGSATPAERERIVRLHTSGILASAGFFNLLGRLFGVWDVIWFGLAIASAWKIAQQGPT